MGATIQLRLYAEDRRQTRPAPLEVMLLGPPPPQTDVLADVAPDALEPQILPSDQGLWFHLIPTITELQKSRGP